MTQQPPISPEDDAPDTRDINVPEQTPSPTRPESTTPATPATPPATRDADAQDAPPPMNAPARGVLGQMLPDVATGSTPVTRRDD